MLCAATLSRLSPSVIRSRERACLEPWRRHHELVHNDGVNRLAVRFGQEHSATVAAWRSEVKMPGAPRTPHEWLVPSWRVSTAESFNS